MFDRFVRMAEARSALRKGRFEQALELARDPLLRDHRRAVEIRDAALRGLMERAARRREAGGLADAMSDISTILSAEPEYAGARTLKAELQEAMKAAETGEQAGKRMLQDARQRVERGELAAAEEICAGVADVRSLQADREAVEKLISSRREAADRFVTDAEKALRSGDVEQAVDLVARAKAHSRELPRVGALADRVAVAWGKKLLPRLKKLRAAGDEAAARQLLTRERRRLPALESVPGLRDFAAAAASLEVDELRARLDAEELDEAVELYRERDLRLADEASAAPFRAGMDELVRGLDLRDRGDFDGAVESLTAAHQRIGSKGISRVASRLKKEGDKAAAALDKARGLAAGGRLIEARQELMPVLETWPMHEAVRSEMELLDRGARDKESRLALARDLAKDGRLREASAQVLALAVPGPHGEEARLLLKELQARMDLVQRGLDQVRRAVHGRHSGSVEGLRHCALRLGQLETVQSDSEDLSGLKKAVESELEGVLLLEAARDSLERGGHREVAEKLAELPDHLATLLRPDRLDARCLEIADKIRSVVEDAQAAGRLTAAQSWLDALSPLAATYPDVREWSDGLIDGVRTRREAAEVAASRGEAALDARDLTVAESCLETARRAWVDGAPVTRLETALRIVHGQQIALEEVEQLTADEDYEAAHRKLDHMPPTPGVLRTRIFDIKKGLAQAQGLDAGFLLRVDEGGEFLVLRSDSISIGNVRDGKTDLVLLASIAGRHATITRSMSFHGGMQDQIRADNGEVSVRGRKVKEHKLKSGDRVRLGSALEFAYRVPSSRSLTAALTLSSGFQVAGTDKILLMRDRGRDGRILIGASADAHVRVPYDQPEVELFALKDGQIRVRFDGDGSIGGKRFRGEHPAAAGEVIQCGALSFVLQPWSKTR